MAKETKTEDVAANEEPRIEMTKTELEALIASMIEKHDKESAAEAKAGSKAESEEQKKDREYYEELVTINLFMDNDKYKDDVIVSVNGTAWQLKRGEDIQVPRYIAQVLNDSLQQDKKTSLMIRNMEEKYVRDSR